MVSETSSVSLLNIKFQIFWIKCAWGTGGLIIARHLALGGMLSCNLGARGPVTARHLTLVGCHHSTWGRQAGRQGQSKESPGTLTNFQKLKVSRHNATQYLAHRKLAYLGQKGKTWSRLRLEVSINDTTVGPQHRHICNHHWTKLRIAENLGLKMLNDSWNHSSVCCRSC